MIVSFRKLLIRLQFTLLFLALTMGVFAGYRFLLHWIDFSDPYAVPKGDALKVFGEDLQSSPGSMPLSFAERLRMFYTYGE
jgi:hypothetical protein